MRGIQAEKFARGRSFEFGCRSRRQHVRPSLEQVRFGRFHSAPLAPGHGVAAQKLGPCNDAAGAVDNGLLGASGIGDQRFRFNPFIESRKAADNLMNRLGEIQQIRLRGRFLGC